MDAAAATAVAWATTDLAFSAFPARHFRLVHRQLALLAFIGKQRKGVDI
jgi:hypothetical protein